MGLRRTARRHTTAGVDPTIYYEFRPGQRVLTREGISGTVTAVEDGPHPGSEQYVVTLDGGLGGGEYAAGELRSAPGVTAAAEGQVEIDGVQSDLHPGRTAADDYPELGTILLDRPNHPHALVVGASLNPEDWHNSDGFSFAPADQWNDDGTLADVVADHLITVHRAETSRDRLPTDLDEIDQYHFEDHSMHGECGAHEPELTGRASLDTSIPLGNTIPVREGGLVDRFLDRFNDSAEKALGHPGVPTDPNNVWSYDWCRFRKRRRCMFPTSLNAEATAEAGYPVWNPLDRGLCPRDDWDQQRACPVAEPGPRSGHADAQVDATVPWEQGGQRRGSRVYAEIDPADPNSGLREVEEVCVEDGHTHSGLVIKAVDSGRVLLVQRTPYAEDPEGVFGRWEFPGGSIGDGETAFASALREFGEETGLGLPDGWVVDGCYENGKYVAIIVLVPNEAWTTDAELLTFETMGLGWFHPDQIEGTTIGREEMEKADWDMVREALRRVSSPITFEEDDLYQLFGEVALPPYPDGQGGVIAESEQIDCAPIAQHLEERIEQTRIAAVDPEFRFHFTAGWRDVQAKAKRIRTAGGVRIIASPGRDGLYITAEVRGETNVYRTTLMREPGKKSIASWECGCAWAAYSWGRSGRWKRYEGRMCSHALALAYEAQAQEMFGREIEEQPNKPPWRSDSTIPVKTPGDYKRAPYTKWRTGSLRSVAVDPDLAVAPVVAVVAAALSDGAHPNDLLEELVGAGVQDAPTIMEGAFKTARATGFKGKVRGWVTNITEVVDGTKVRLETGDEVPSHQVFYPTYDPRLGLDLRDSIPRISSRVEGQVDVGGVMVALRPPENVCRVLAEIADEPFDQLHVTLAYLGKADTVDQLALVESVRDWVRRGASSLTGRVAGFGMFLNGEEQVVYASMDVPGIDTFRSSLVQHLRSMGFNVAQDHGFTPHLTLAYGANDVPKEVPNGADRDFVFDEVIVAYDNDWHYIPLAPLGALTFEMPWWAGLSGFADAAVVIGGDPGVSLPLEGSPEAAAGVMQIGPAIAKDQRFEGVGGPLQDDDGWFVRTHRARSDSYPSPEDIPDSVVEFIRSTGMTDDVFLFEADLVSDAFDALEEGWRNGEVDADRISWYAPGDDGQALTQEDLAPTATLHDEPEAALPETDGEENAEILLPSVLLPGAGIAGAPLVQEGTARPTTAGVELPAWLAGSDESGASHIARQRADNVEIATMARRVLKEGLKAFSPAEQAEIINEGEEATAANLDLLDIAGTHYEALEAALGAEEEEDLLWL